jgi:putative transposase
VSFAREYPDFFTATCLEWNHLLEDDSIKDIIVDSMRFLAQEKRVNIFTFCIMNNHIHLIWQMLGEHKREQVQRDFLKYTGQEILRKIKENNSSFLSKLLGQCKRQKVSSMGAKCPKFPPC